MNTQEYWFPVRPAAYGWGWGLPVKWQGWAALAAWFALFIGGLALLAPYGQTAMLGFGAICGAGLIGLMYWKGEPQHMRGKKLY